MASPASVTRSVSALKSPLLFRNRRKFQLGLRVVLESTEPASWGQQGSEQDSKLTAALAEGQG